jgi:hypothetical protein
LQSVRFVSWRMRRVHNIEPTVAAVPDICRAHSKEHMDMFHARYRNTALQGTYTLPIRWGANHSRILIGILVSKI